MKVNEDIGIHNLLRQSEYSQDEYQKLIYAVSHDLAAPIRSVVSFAKLLKKSAEENLTEKELHYLSYVIDNGEKAQNMFLGLLEYSRLLTRSGEHVRLDVNDIVRQTLELLAKPISDSGASIKVDKLPSVYAEPNQLARLFFSLIENAVKFRKAGVAPEITISAHRYGKGHKFVITDNGIGIDEKHAGQIFDVFKRLNAEKDYPGIGMGLPIAKRIMDLHGGEIWVNSNLGKGSEFIMFFPDFNKSSRF
jgi:light-regulated signal transduction histidine kinase (bacteriophytochrome)